MTHRYECLTGRFTTRRKERKKKQGLKDNAETRSSQR
jgi:hypothetical protein